MIASSDFLMFIVMLGLMVTSGATCVLIILWIKDWIRKELW